MDCGEIWERVHLDGKTVENVRDERFVGACETKGIDGNKEVRNHLFDRHAFVKIWNCICHVFAGLHTHPRHPSAQLKELLPRWTRLLGHVLFFNGRVRYNLFTIPIHIVLPVLLLIYWIKLYPTICGNDVIFTSHTVLASAREIDRLFLRCWLVVLATLALWV